MIKEKKGLGFSTFAILIIALVVLFVLLNYTSTSANILKKGGDVEICRLSVLAHAQTKFIGDTPISLKCPRKQVKFFNDKVEINGKKEAKYEFNQLDNNIINKVVAEELRQCWYKMGEGEIDIFRQNLALDGENVCVVCTEIGFDKGVSQKEFTGIIDYLKTKKIPGKDTYYIDYLVRSQNSIYLKIPYLGLIPYSNILLSSFLGVYGTTDLIREPQKAEDSSKSKSFESSKNYVVYFLGFKPDKLSEYLKEFESAYYIGLGEPGKVAKECRRLVS